MKIIHCSDLHLGKKPSGTKKYSDTRFEDFFKAFDNLIEKVATLEVDVFIISGDLFDKKEINANILEKTENLLKKLKQFKKNMRIVAIEGNHDIISSKEDSWLEYLKTKGYLEVYSYKEDFEKHNHFKIDDVNFYAVGYPGFMVDKALEKLAENLNKDEKNIVIVHTGISDSNTLPGLVSTKTIDLFKDKVTYMAAGHIHSFTTYPKENPYFFISGSLEFSNIANEKSDKKGAVYFDTNTRTFEFIEVEHRKRIKTPAFEFEEDIEKELENYIKNLNLTGEEILIIPIRTTKNQYINIDNLYEIAEKNGALKADFPRDFQNNYGISTSENEYIDIENIEKILIKEWKDFENKELLAENFSLLKNLYQNKEEESFIELFDKILEGDNL